MKENRIDLSKLIGKKFKVPEMKYKRFKEDKPATIYTWVAPKGKHKAVSENEKIREMLNDPEVIGKAAKGAIKAQRKMAGLEN